MQIRCLVWALLALPLVALQARAETVTLDTISVALELPPGFCALSRDHPADKVHYELQDKAQSGQNIVIRIAVPCSDIEPSRRGNPFSRWAIWLQTGPSPIVVPAGQSRDEALKEIESQIPKLDVDAMSAEIEAKSRQQSGPTIKVNNFGILGRDENGLYAGMVADASKGSVKRNLAVVFGWVVLSRRIFTFNLYRDFESRATFDLLLNDVKAIAARSTAASDALPIDKSLPPSMQKRP